MRDDVPLLRVGVLQGLMLHELPADADMYLSEFGSVAVIASIEATAEEAAEFQQRLAQGLLPILMCDSVEDHLAYHGPPCAEVIRQGWPSVRAQMQVGIHPMGREVVVTDRIELDSPLG